MNIFKSKLFYVAVVIIAVGFYLFLSDFQILKNLVGYNVPPLATPPILEPGQEDKENEFPFLSLADQFSITSFAVGLNKPRVIEFDPADRMLISETRAGNIVILEDADKDGKVETKRTLITGLDRPHGISFYKNGDINYLYIAETHQVVRYIYDIASGTISDERVIADLPSGGGHFTRTLGFGHDRRLYISIGSSCNVCNESDERRASIYSMNWDGSDFIKYADGLRNAVFFAFHPVTGQMWATEMGRDHLGDDLPPDEMNIVREDEWYGWPWFYGKNIEDFDFSPNVRPAFAKEPVPSLIDLQAHSAPLGLAFVPREFSRDWEGDLLVAYHGSWNRSEPTGYKIVKFNVDGNGNVLGGEEDFISGWLASDNKVFGRPVDLKFSPNGVLYISDDAAGVIYKVVPR